MYKVTLKECGRETARWHRFYFMWRDNKESQIQKWAALSDLTPESFDKRFYYFT